MASSSLAVVFATALLFACMLAVGNIGWLRGLVTPPDDGAPPGSVAEFKPDRTTKVGLVAALVLIVLIGLGLSIYESHDLTSVFEWRLEILGASLCIVALIALWGRNLWRVKLRLTNDGVELLDINLRMHRVPWSQVHDWYVWWWRGGLHLHLYGADKRKLIAIPAYLERWPVIVSTVREQINARSAGRSA